jgi:asparagine synthase (glutamine-hydrolysing)
MGFVGLRWTPADRDRGRAARALSERLCGERGWTTLMDWRGVLVLHKGDEPVETLPHGMGFVFGERFGRLDPDPSPPCSECVDFVPDWIADRWGAYVAILIDRGFDIVRVLRDPSGAYPCYLSDLSDVSVFFCRAEDFIALSPGVEPDLDAVRDFLRYPARQSRRTGLRGVDELAPGECAIYPREGCSLQAYWTPHGFAKHASPLDFAEGRQALRSAAQACVQAYAQRHTKIALRLSGGFDSSTVLGLLRTCSDAEIIAVNEFWEGAPEGDEREQAREVAKRSGVVLHERRVDPSLVNYERCLHAVSTVKPTMSLLGVGDPASNAFYEGLGCGLVTSGQGGDHLFHRSRTPWIAADALRDGLPTGRLLSIAIETARLTRKSVWDVFAAMAKGAVRWPMEFDRRSSVMGVLLGSPSDDKNFSPHTWLVDVTRASPARALRIHQFLHALCYFDEVVFAPGINQKVLLFSQPIIETCLRIPPYVMTAGGHERALARAAFADLVPEHVLQRVSKGETTRFFASVLSANGDFLRSLLLGGRLVELGIVDKAALTSALGGAWLQSGLAADGLYALIAAECWLRNLQTACAAVSVA